MSLRERQNGYGPTPVLDIDADRELQSLSRRGAAPVPNKSASLGAQITQIPCPCCGHAIKAPTLDQVIEHYQISPQSARLLTAVWRGRGLPVSTERIVDQMWADDADGGPPEARAYRYFQWSLWDLRAKLEGSGIGIVNAGYRSGYRLIMGVAQKET